MKEDDDIEYDVDKNDDRTVSYYNNKDNDDNIITNTKNNNLSFINENRINSKKKISFINDVMHIMFLGVGASSLSIVKVPYNISIILTIIFIILIKICNIYFSYFPLIDIIDETKKKHKRSILNKNEGNAKEKKKEIVKEKKKEIAKEKEKERRAKIYKDLCKQLNAFNIPFFIGEIIIHQVLFYRSLGGIVNIIGEFNYDSLFMFLSDTYWKDLSMKFVVNIIICLLLICPIYLKMDAKTIDSFPKIGFYIILFIVLGVFFQFFYYFINYCRTEFNYRDLRLYPNKTECIPKIFQSLAIFFYCYSGHNGFFNQIPMEEELKQPEIRRKEFMRANILNMLIYFVFSCLGFLSVPTDVVDIVTEKKRFWNKDIIMTISRILLLPFCLFKIIINFDKLKTIVIGNKEKINKIRNFIFVCAIFSITCACASLYQNIVGYITLIGGFFVPIPTFLIPQIYWRKYIEKGAICDLINWRIILGIILWFFGIAGSILGIIDIFEGEFNLY